MVYQSVGLAAWPVPLAVDGDRPWQTPSPLPSPDNAGDDYANLLSFGVFQCTFYQSGERRTVRDTKRRLLSEARRLEVGNSPLERRLAADFRHAATCLPQRSRGRPGGDNQARAVVDMVIKELPPALEKAGRANMAATLLDPGQAPREDSYAPGKATGLNTVMGVAMGAAEVAGLGIPRRSFKDAVENIRRAQRRRR